MVGDLNEEIELVENELSRVATYSTQLYTYEDIIAQDFSIYEAETKKIT